MYTLIRNDSDFNSILPKIQASDIIAFDTENDGLNPKFAKPVGFSFTINGSQGFYVPIDHTDIKTDLHKRFNELIKGKDIIIMHNSPYDAAIVKSQYGLTTNIIEDIDWFDTMIAAHLINENGDKGLKKLSEKHFGYKQDTYKETVGDQLPSKISSTRIYKYAIDDALMTFKLYKKFKVELEEDKLEELFYDIEMPFQKVLTSMKLNGVCFDSKLNEQIEKDLIINISSLKIKLMEFVKPSPQQTLFGAPVEKDINFDSSQQLAQLLYTDLELPIIDRTNKGAPACNTKALLKMKDDNKQWIHAVIPILIKYKKINKLISSFTHSLREKVIEDKIYPNFLDHGTATGRLSCIAKGTKIQTVRDFSKEPEGKNIEDINIGDFIYCSNSKGQLQIRQVKSLIPKGTQECIKLKWKSLSNKFDGELICTPDHKIKTLDDTWKRADEIKLMPWGELNRLRRLGEDLPLDNRVYSLHFQLNKYAYIYYSGMKKVKNIRWYAEPSGSDHVHHKDGNKLNDVWNNLEVLSPQAHARLHLDTSGGFYNKKTLKKAHDSRRKNILLGLTKCTGKKKHLTKEYCLQIAHRNKGMIKYIIKNENHDFETIKREMIRNGIDLKEIKKLYEETNHYIVDREYVGEQEVYDLTIDSNEGDGCFNFFASEICVHNCTAPNLQQLARETDPEEDMLFVESCKPFGIDTLMKSLKHVNIRDCFIASPGYKLFVADFSQEELRLMGILSESKRFKEAFERGDDMHLSTAKACFNLDIPDEALTKKHPDYKKYKEKYSAFRKKAKFVNFGIGYGISAVGLSNLINSTEDEAQMMLDNFAYNNSEFMSFKEKTNLHIKRRGWVRTILGRKRRFYRNDEGYYDSKCYRQGNNFLIQSVAADILRKVMNNCYDYTKTTNDEVRVISTVHDEILFEIKNNKNLKVHGDEVKKIMETTFNFDIDLPADADYGETYGECK